MAMTSTERSRKLRMQRSVATESNATEIVATSENATERCNHPPIVAVTAANRHLTYSKYGPPMGDLERYKAGMPEPVLFTCPCCGKEWLCKRPDVQDAYCLRCDRTTALSWRLQHPYLRPPMAERSEALREFHGSAIH